MNNFCPNCGSPTTSDSLFCASCGQDLGYAPPPALAPEPTGPRTSLRPVALLVTSVGLLIAGLVITLVVLLSGGGDPEDTVRDYIEAANRGDCDRLVELTYFDESSDQTEAELREDCTAPDPFEVDYEILGSDDLDTDLPSGVDDAAAVEVRITAEVYGSTQSETSEVTVYLVDGDWLLHDDDSSDE